MGASLLALAKSIYYLSNQYVLTPQNYQPQVHQQNKTQSRAVIQLGDNVSPNKNEKSA